MKRRQFSTAGSVLGGWVALGGSGLLVAETAIAQAAIPQAGKEFLVLETPVPSDVPAGKVEVLEFFRYSCPHCFDFERILEGWIKRLPPDVVFKRNPVSFGDEGGVLQRLYFALEAMGLLEKLHAKVFNAIHLERLPLSKDEAVIDWIAKQGVDRAKFQDQYKSFTTSSKARRATQMQNQYQVESVPSFGVAGKFYTGGGLTRSQERALQVVEYLASEVRAKKR
ncbi:MAG: disulfide bond formation protein DsbA [Burkholderiales bacterium PBB4]|nr:MAG: disulfide bond formation protein DsbA [Burkholderiales bacterium PBB4]